MDKHDFHPTKTLPAPPVGLKGWPWELGDATPGTPPAGGWPKITLITPSYNQGHFIEETIRSVLGQGYPNLEYLIFDGGSTDNTVQILEKYSPWLTHWESKPDKGQSDAINKGLVMASGDIINWLNSDDTYQPLSLFAVARAFAEQPGTHCVAGKSRIFSEAGEERLSRGTDVFPGNLAKTIGWARIDQPETFFSGEAVRKMGPLDPRFHFTMDREWWVRFLLHFGLEPIRKIPDVLVNFRLHEASKTVSLNDSFNFERDSFFCSLARQLEEHDMVAAVQSRYEKPLTDFQEIIPYQLLEKHRDTLHSALHYFALQVGNECYEIQNKHCANRVFKLVDPSKLHPQDARQLKSLRRRNRLPRVFINVARKVSRAKARA